MNHAEDDPRRGFGAFLRTAVGRLVAIYLKGVWASGRWRTHIPPSVETLYAARAPFILAFHHGRFAMAPFAKRGRRFVAMVSRSKDGDLISAGLHGLGVETARGSPKSGGPRALAAMRRAMREGACAAFTTDGPKGPAGVSKPGVAALARATGALTVPLSSAASAGFTARSWDRFFIPAPFARGAVVFGEPLSAPEPGEDADFLVALDRELENALARAETLVGRRRAP